jgi:hypothetical protein
MAINNPELYNAAVVGAVTGALLSRVPTTDSITFLQANAQAFAAAVDAAIAPMTVSRPMVESMLNMAKALWCERCFTTAVEPSLVSSFVLCYGACTALTVTEPGGGNMTMVTSLVPPEAVVTATAGTFCHQVGSLCAPEGFVHFKSQGSGSTGWRQLTYGSAGDFAPMMFGTASPEGAVTADPGMLYNYDSGSGNQLWFKKSGYSNTGWVNITTLP